VRKDLITPQVEKILQQRRKEIEDGAELVSLEEVLKKAAARNKKATISKPPTSKATASSDEELAAG
jgi:hypothetical protein